MTEAAAGGGGSAMHIKWAAEVAAHDYAAAEAYLSLKLSEAAVAKAVERLRNATLTTWGW